MTYDTLARITQEFIDDDCGSAYNINNGYCEEWAYAVLEALKDTPHQVGFWETDIDLAYCAHAFVEIDGKFYDAECLDGVADYMQLPLFAKVQDKLPPGEVDPVQLQDYNDAYVIHGPTRLGYTPELLAEAEARDKEIEAA